MGTDSQPLAELGPLLSLFFACFGTSTFLLFYIYVEQLCVVPIWDKTEMQLKKKNHPIAKDRQQAVGEIDPL